MTDVSSVSVELLTAPSVDRAIGTVADIGEAQQLIVRIEPYEGMSDGDSVHLRWDTGVLRTSRIDTHVVDATEVGLSTVFTIPQPMPGSARVSYVVSRPSGECRASERLEVTVRR
ncbi:hypothetical protein AB0B50_20060 [Streptomyces sp. NPDC041068]|uniref:hypothetical protein n=1 Tax=Streptomyces sp. NPDC041068 TaxID=3155130 RepID=UPI0033CC4D72